MVGIQPTPTHSQSLTPMLNILSLLDRARQDRASDLHLQINQPVWARVDGGLARVSEQALTVQDLQTALQVLNIAHEKAGQPVAANSPQNSSQNAQDIALSDPRFGRLRVHLSHQQLQQQGAEQAALSIAIRLIADQLPTLEQLPAHPTLTSLATSLRHGLVLFCGKAGSGKSTTLAAFVDHINRHSARHIITLEDPIEQLYTPALSLISQRQVGIHTASFASGLREALRQDPDVIVVGELRDSESIALALQASDTGHLVLATLHASRVPLAVNRVVDSFGDAAKGFALPQFADCLQAIVCQQLWPRAVPDPAHPLSANRVPVFEVLVASAGVRNLIRDNKTPQLHSMMQVGFDHGMVTLEDHLAQLRRSGVLAPEPATARPIYDPSGSLYGT